MSECGNQTPGAIPTTNSPTSGSTGLSFLDRFCRSDRPESPKALVLYQSAVISGLTTFGLGLACMVRISWAGDVGMGAVYVFVASATITGGLAGWHKVSDPNVGAAASPAPGPSPSASDGGLGGAKVQP